MQRFYYEAQLWDDLDIKDEALFHQISHVMRSRIWDEICLFNSDSNNHIYSISSISKNHISLKFISKSECNTEPDRHIRLFQAMPNKFDKIELIIQKWVEVWITDFIFFDSERSQKLQLTDSKISRLKNIAREALEQSGWCIMPNISFVSKLDYSDFSDSAFFAHTQNAFIKPETLDVKNKIDLLVWPEWWWGNAEIEKFKQSWIKPINFWNRILRSETAWMLIAFFLIHN